MMEPKISWPPMEVRKFDYLKFDQILEKVKSIIA